MTDKLVPFHGFVYNEDNFLFDAVLIWKLVEAVLIWKLVITIIVTCKGFAILKE